MQCKHALGKHTQTQLLCRVLFLVHIITSHPSWKSAVDPPVLQASLHTALYTDPNFIGIAQAGLQQINIYWIPLQCQWDSNKAEFPTDRLHCHFWFHMSVSIPAHLPGTRALFWLTCRPWQHAKGKDRHTAPLRTARYQRESSPWNKQSPPMYAVHLEGIKYLIS